MPSRLSAEPLVQAERNRLLARVQRVGNVEDFSGVRIAQNGQRFWVRDAHVWNIVDPREQYCGQAASFDHWDRLWPRN